MLDWSSLASVVCDIMRRDRFPILTTFLATLVIVYAEVICIWIINYNIMNKHCEYTWTWLQAYDCICMSYCFVCNFVIFCHSMLPTTPATVRTSSLCCSSFMQQDFGRFYFPSFPSLRFFHPRTRQTVGGEGLVLELSCWWRMSLQRSWKLLGTVQSSSETPHMFGQKPKSLQFIQS